MNENVSQVECLERNVDTVTRLNGSIDAVEGRVARLEEQVNGDMGIIRTLKDMNATMQSLRDAMNRQAWLLPLATAIITAVAVGFFK